MTKTLEQILEEFEEEKSKFLVFDKASGSRWLDEEKLKAFLSHTFSAGEQKGREEAVEYIKIHADPVDIEAGFDLEVWDELLEQARKGTEV